MLHIPFLEYSSQGIFRVGHLIRHPAACGTAAEVTPTNAPHMFDVSSGHRNSGDKPYLDHQKTQHKMPWQLNSWGANAALL
jgi:hypothetical protein